MCSPSPLLPARSHLKMFRWVYVVWISSWVIYEQNLNHSFVREILKGKSRLLKIFRRVYVVWVYGAWTTKNIVKGFFLFFTLLVYITPPYFYSFCLQASHLCRAQITFQTWWIVQWLKENVTSVFNRTHELEKTHFLFSNKKS